MKNTPPTFESPKLYLGLAIDQTLSQALEGVDPKIYAHYTQQSPYLLEVVFANQKFLAKVVGASVEFENLLLLESHLLSLLKKLVPEYPFSSDQLTIFSKS